MSGEDSLIIMHKRRMELLYDILSMDEEEQLAW